MATILDYYVTGLWIGLMGLVIYCFLKAGKRRSIKEELDSAQIAKSFRRYETKQSLPLQSIRQSTLG